MSETILWALAEWSIRSAALIAAVALALWMFRFKDAHARLTAWTVVLVAVLLLPLASLWIPHIPVSVPRFFARHQTSSLAAQPALPFAFRTDPAPTTAQRSDRPGWPDFASALWLAVVLAMLFRLALGLRLSTRMLRASTLAEPGFRESDWLRVPVTVGIFRPVVVLPADWRAWPADKLQAVLAHEWAHVARRDPLRQFAASMYRALAWFHPLAWWLRMQLVELAEEASDDAALAASEDRARYAEMLLNFIEKTPHRVEWVGVTMANRRTRRLRIDRILDQERIISRPSAWRAAALIVAALPIVYVTASIRPVLAQETAAAQASDITPQTCGGDPASVKWLTEDVAYIIVPAERKAFVGLATREECAMFIEQFWQRRASPGTFENHFKNEHYRRLAYANAHFASPRTPGWQTDRGRVYITYGPPDELESHPEGGGGADPKQQWLYHHTDASTGDVLFEFTDIGHNGEYRITFMGDGARSERGPVVFGPVGGLYVQVNKDRTIFITTPAGRTVMPVHAGIIDRNGATVARFDDLSRTLLYGKGVSTSLAAGTYTLHLQVGPEDRSISFEVK